MQSHIVVVYNIYKLQFLQLQTLLRHQILLRNMVHDGLLVFWEPAFLSESVQIKFIPLNSLSRTRINHWRHHSIDDNFNILSFCLFLIQLLALFMLYPRISPIKEWGLNYSVDIYWLMLLFIFCMRGISYHQVSQHLFFIYLMAIYLSQ